MERYEKKSPACINWRVLFLLSVFLLLCYQNTFNASWHFDDFRNIIRNTRVHIENLHPGTLFEAVFWKEDNSGVSGRPVAFFTFALNWYYGKTDVSGYHVVNLSVHILTAFFLYLTVLALFRTPNLAGRYTGSEHFIALLAAVLWAANPIQTQAVTYIVQRMASMAAMFYVLGIFLYLKARIATSIKIRLVLYSGVLAAFLLAVGTKENAFMLPASLFLVEIVFFRDLADPETRKKIIWAGLSMAFVLFVGGLVFFMNDGFLSRLQNSYANRTFTLTERVLTQPRIVVFYISQIFYPIADRLSIEHDIELSTSLFRPWTTLPAILLILGLIGASFRGMAKYPLISFAVLFFFLNHVIESSIMPLELVFEHRNYLPSLFLFVPVAAGVKYLFDSYQKEKHSMAAIIIIFTTILIILLGTGTYVRNMAWSNQRTLWQDAMEKAPERARPYVNLSAHYALIGEYDRVIELNKKALHLKALHLKTDTRKRIQKQAFRNLAAAFIRREGNHDQAIKMYNRFIDIDPDEFGIHYKLALSLIHVGQLDEAMHISQQLVNKLPENIHVLNTTAFIHLRKDEPEKALPLLIQAVPINPDDNNTIIGLALVNMKTGRYSVAERHLKRIPDHSTQRTTAILLLIENSARAGDFSKAKTHAQQLLARKDPEIIAKKLLQTQDHHLAGFVSTEVVAPVIAEQLQKKSKQFLQLRTTDGS